MAQRAAELTIVLQAKNLAKQAIDRLNKQLGGLTGKIKKYQNEIRTVSKLLVGASVVGAALFTGAIVQAAGFEKALSNVTAVTNASIADQKRLRDAALEMGSKSIFAASQAAEAQLFLGQAGQSTTEIIQSLDGVMSLAAATSSDLAFTSEVTASTLSQFGLAAGEAARVANVFAASSSVSQANLNKLAFAMRQAGPDASALNQSLEGTTAALNAFFDLGLKGEQAGTVLRAALVGLAKPSAEAGEILERLGITIFDTSGKMLPFVDIVGQLEKANLSTTDSFTIFGTEAGGKMAKLVEKGSQALREMEERITGTDEAARQAKVRTDNLIGSITKMKSAIEGASISIGSEYIPAIRLVTDLMTGWVGEFNALDQATKSLTANIALGVTVLAGLVGGLGLLVVSLAVTKFALGTLALSFGALLKIIGKVGLGLAAFSFGWNIGTWLNNFKIIRLTASHLIQFFHESFIGLFLAWDGFMILLATGVKGLVDLLPSNAFFDAISKSMTAWTIEHNNAFDKGIEDLKRVRENWEGVREEIEKQGDTFGKTAEQAKKLGDAMKDAPVQAFNAAQKQIAAQEKVIENTKKQTQAVYDLAQAEVKVLEVEKAVVAEQLKAANERAAALKQILDVEANLKAFITQLDEKGLSREEKDKNELIRQEQALAQVVRQSGEEKIALLREVRFLQGEEKQAVVKRLEESSLNNRVVELRKVVGATQALALAAEKGSVQERRARELTIQSREKLKKTLIDLGIVQGRIDAQALRSGKSIEDQYRTTLHQVDQLQAKFETLQGKIKDIKARITITDQQKLIRDAQRLRANLEAQFSQPIVQRVILSQVNESSSSSFSRSIRTTRTLSGGVSLSNVGRFAAGLNRVPYDNFPALLHRNERVLTASEAKQDGDSQRSITITFGDIITHAKDSDELARELAPMLLEEIETRLDRIN